MTNRFRLRIVIAGIVTGLSFMLPLASAQNAESLTKQLSSQDAEQRVKAAFLLGEMGEVPAPAIPKLIEILADGWGRGTYYTVYRNDETGKLDVGLMEHSNLHENSPYTSRVAAEALSQIGKPAVPALIAALKHSSHETRLHAVQCLWDIKDARAFQPLIEAMATQDGNMRVRAVQALIALDDPRTFDAMADALKDENIYTRQAAAKAFELLRDSRAFEALIPALNDKDREVKIAAASALAYIDHPDVVEPLLQSLKDDDWYVRRWIASAFAKVNDPRIVDALIGRVQDQSEHPVVRQTAAAALGWLGSSRAAQPILDLLVEPDDKGYGKSDLITALGRIALARAPQSDPSTSPDIAAVLIEVLEQADDDTVQRAAEALLPLKDSRAVNPLIACLEHENMGLRGISAEALGEIGDTRAVDALISALDDTYWFARKNAAEALGKLGDTRALEALTKLQDDTVMEVKNSATAALHQIEGSLL